MTSLASGPARTPDSRVTILTHCRAVTVPPTSLSQVGSKVLLTKCQFHLCRLKIIKHCEQQGEPDAELLRRRLISLHLQKRKAHRLPYGSFLCDYDASSFSICRMLPYAEMGFVKFSLFEECLHDVLIAYPEEDIMMFFSFLTFNMEVSFLIDWDNQDSLLLLIKLSNVMILQVAQFHPLCMLPSFTQHKLLCKELRIRGAKSLTTAMLLFNNLKSLNAWTHLPFTSSRT